MSGPPIDESLLAFATEIVREAGEYTLGVWRSAEFHIEHKGDGSPVTEADLGAERLLRDRIHERFPDDAILGEEQGQHDGSSGRRWVIDPIDGTYTFTRGVALYSNLLYLEDEHGPAVGVINVPGIGELVAAGRGRGCFLNGQRCHVNDHPTLEHALLNASGFDWWDPELLERVHRSGVHMRTWGDGYGYLLVATGRAEAMVDPVASFWDIAACQVVIAEAGGTWSTLTGTRDAHEGSFVATNGRIHDELLEAIGD
ncbi:MAG TPA: inositol monophosphatase family protein [Microthrixaceae bacterium]|nr:inositol monophosphatase family protein [Microthrixaceae bacterium]